MVKGQETQVSILHCHREDEDFLDRSQHLVLQAQHAEESTCNLKKKKEENHIPPVQIEVVSHIVMDMAPDSFDDQYEGCHQQLMEELDRGGYFQKELARCAVQSVIFAGDHASTWQTSPSMEQWRVAGPHQCLREEAVQSQLRSSRRKYDSYGQISRAMLERGHDQDALQCRVKVKELRSAYCKARKGNRRSGAAPTTCCFYKELDVILGGEPTTTPRTMMDTSEQGEEEEEESESEGTGIGGDTPESQEACSQELFSSQEEGSQSQQLVLGGGQTEEQVREATLRSWLPMLSMSQRLQNLWKKLRKRRPAASSYEALCHRESKSAGLEGKGKQDPPEKCSGQEEKHKAADKHRGAPSGLYPGARSHASRALPRPLPHHPKALSLVPQCQLKTPFPSIQVLTTTSCLQHLYVHQPALRTTTLTLCIQPSSPCSIAILKCSSHCTALQTGHIQTCDCTVPHPTPLPF
ncbi:ecto-ADP-ribosyltransferase 4 isoform 4-T5 [Pangshura tecta]